MLLIVHSRPTRGYDWLLVRDLCLIYIHSQRFAALLNSVRERSHTRVVRNCRVARISMRVAWRTRRSAFAVWLVTCFVCWNSSFGREEAAAELSVAQPTQPRVYSPTSNTTDNSVSATEASREVETPKPVHPPGRVRTAKLIRDLCRLFSKLSQLCLLFARSCTRSFDKKNFARGVIQLFPILTGYLFVLSLQGS